MSGGWGSARALPSVPVCWPGRRHSGWEHACPRAPGCPGGVEVWEGLSLSPSSAWGRVCSSPDRVRSWHDCVSRPTPRLQNVAAMSTQLPRKPAASPGARSKDKRQGRLLLGWPGSPSSPAPHGWPSRGRQATDQPLLGATLTAPPIRHDWQLRTWMCALRENKVFSRNRKQKI